jgi:hypothetical protein
MTDAWRLRSCFRRVAQLLSFCRSKGGSKPPAATKTQRPTHLSWSDTTTNHGSFFVDVVENNIPHSFFIQSLGWVWCWSWFVGSDDAINFFRNTACADSGHSRKRDHLREFRDTAENNNDQKTTSSP